jgi:hypothetical protein
MPPAPRSRSRRRMDADLVCVAGSVGTRTHHVEAVRDLAPSGKGFATAGRAEVLDGAYTSPFPSMG